MSAEAQDIIAWLKTFEPDVLIGIDDGGLTLVPDEPENDAYYEIGGTTNKYN